LSIQRKTLLGIFGVLTLVLIVGVTAQAQLPKQGKYRGMFSAWSAGTTHEIEQGQSLLQVTTQPSPDLLLIFCYNVRRSGVH
jgi:hypothetical protein